ncbi:MAG: hypothetical protein ABI645_02720 [Pseudomonadota bacterium]
MFCARYSDTLSEVAAGGRTTADLDAHLAGCVRCSKELAALRQMLAIADDELGQPLTVQPSASFVPRIRAAVIKSAPAQVRRLLVSWPSLATAAALIMTFILVLIVRPLRSPVLTVEHPQQTPVARPAPEPLREPPEESRIAIAEHVPATPSPRRAIRRSTPTEPEVLVPAGEVQALVKLVEFLNREKVVPELLRASDEPSADLAVLTPITLKPIEIVPLDSAKNIGT